MTHHRVTDVGFVVIGRNEGARLAECLKSLAIFGAPIVYADSASTDGSPELARQLGARVVHLDPSRPMNASRGRQEGLDALRREHPLCRFVQFIDGDCLLLPEWLDAALAFMEENPRAAVVSGRRFEAYPERSFYNRLCDEEWNTPVGKVDASGGDALMRMEALLAVNGFDPSLMASEEPELAAGLRARGWEIWRIDVPMTEHDARIFSFGAYWRRALRAGFGYAQAWRRTEKLGHPIDRRLLVSALFWVVLIPLGCLVAALVVGSPLVLAALPAVYLLQVGRVAAGREGSRRNRWKAAAVIMSIKVAEFARAVRGLVRDGRISAIEYKQRWVASGTGRRCG